jgi:(1->4)-alpha-D-glucan 1-alpha-D-glucosylmutase
VIPLSTYRLQLNRDFDFAAANELVPYLDRLGVDWIYLSPIFAAQPGSTHGYDVIDPTIVNPELGGRRGLDALCRRVHDAGLRVLIDIVPNHQAATKENPRWREAIATRQRGWFDAGWPNGELRYRRFFDVDELVGVRVEDETVFEASHALVFELVDLGVVDGLRVDHVDGLADPGEYLERLRRRAPGAFIVVEKILSRDEHLPPWPIDGTTGYEAAVALTSLCIHPDGRSELEAGLLAENRGAGFDRIERESKSLVLRELFRPAWTQLIELLDDRQWTDSLRALTVALGVYRVYDHSPQDRMQFERAAATLTADARVALGARLVSGAPTELSTRWRQLTGAVMAKGHEDTACYRYPALLAQNEVGGDPGADVHDAASQFHALAGRHRGLVGTSTHDSKRSEDVRARMCVLSERSAEFEAGLARWRDLVEPAAGVTATELRFLAQTLLGSWPFDADELNEYTGRIAGYMRKALREAKQKTGWIRPDEPHESAVIDCVSRTIADRGRLLRDAFGSLVDDVMFFGAVNSLAALTWKLAMPGTPDIYRGNELWDFSLVDPDNRRPVDFTARERLLPEVQDAGSGELLDDWRSGAVKMFVTAAGLRARRENPELFRAGEYVPLNAPPGVFAFARRHGDDWAVAIAPRLATRVTSCGRWPIGPETWGDAVLSIPDGRRTEIALADALGSLPVALLVRLDDDRN